MYGVQCYQMARLFVQYLSNLVTPVVWEQIAISVTSSCSFWIWLTDILFSFYFQDNAVATNGASVSQSDLDAMKQEILREMRLEINKMKQEIIEGQFYRWRT